MTATLAPSEPDTSLDYPDTLLIGDHPANAHDTDSWGCPQIVDT